MDQRNRQRRIISTEPLRTNPADARSGGPRLGPAARTVSIRAPRGRELVERIGDLDTELSDSAREEIVAWISNAYASRIGSVPVGFIARCHLGPPYIDHRLGLTHAILEHFRPQDTPPAPFGSGRSLARSRAYAYIEVYDDGTLIPVREDGTIVPP